MLAATNLNWQADDANGVKHVVRIQKADPEDFANSKRIQITINSVGNIEEVSPPDSDVFGWCVAFGATERVDDAWCASV